MLVGSMKENFLLLDVLPFESIYKKIIILYIIKNFESYMDINKVIVKRENRAFDVKMEYPKKTFGQKFIDYLGPKNYNLMPINIKKDIFFTEGNPYNYRNKKKIHIWLFSIL
jgi:hypothetical protein